MSQTRHRRRQWSAHGAAIVARLRQQVTERQRHRRLTDEDLIQEALLEIWKIPPASIVHASDPVELQVTIGSNAIKRAMRRELKQRRRGPYREMMERTGRGSSVRRRALESRR